MVPYLTIFMVFYPEVCQMERSVSMNMITEVLIKNLSSSGCLL